MSAHIIAQNEHNFLIWSRLTLYQPPFGTVTDIYNSLVRSTPYGQPRGFDCRTGVKKWHFHVVPQDSSDPAYSTWWNGTEDAAGGNVWAPVGGDHDTSRH